MDLPSLEKKGIYIYQGRFGISGNYVDIFLSENCDGPTKKDLKFISQVFIETQKENTNIYWGKIENNSEKNLRILKNKNITLIERSDSMKLSQRVLKGDSKLLHINGFGKQVVKYCDK